MPQDLHSLCTSGLRAPRAFVRPYPHLLVGNTLSFEFSIEKARCVLEVTEKPDLHRKEDQGLGRLSEFFVPYLHFGRTEEGAAKLLTRGEEEARALAEPSNGQVDGDLSHVSLDFDVGSPKTSFRIIGAPDKDPPLGLTVWSVEESGGEAACVDLKIEVELLSNAERHLALEMYAEGQWLRWRWKGGDSRENRVYRVRIERGMKEGGKRTKLSLPL